MCSVKPAAEPDGTIGGHGAYQCTAHIVRAVPDTHHGTPLIRREPVRHHAAARRPAHAVEPAHQGVEHAHHQDGQGFVFRADQLDGDNHEAHGNGRKDEPHRQEDAGVGAVGDAAHQEFGQGVCCSVQAQNKAQLGFVETQRRHGRDGHGQVFSHQIESGVANECADEYLQPQAFEFGVGLRAGLCRQIGRLLHEFQHFSIRVFHFRADKTFSLPLVG